MMNLNGYKVLNRIVVESGNSFTVEKIWVEGWIKIPPNSCIVKYINGIQGRETEIEVTRIKPIVCFEVTKR